MNPLPSFIDSAFQRRWSTSGQQSFIFKLRISHVSAAIFKRLHMLSPNSPSSKISYAAKYFWELNPVEKLGVELIKIFVLLYLKTILITHLPYPTNRIKTKIQI